MLPAAAGSTNATSQRHVEVLIEELKLAGTRAVSTPGVDEPANKKEDDLTSAALNPELASAYRALAARCNYIAVDRADAQYAIKELCRDMSTPTEASWSELLRVGRYFLGKPRAVVMFEWQPTASVIDIFTDANWAGCKTARKSTSGGVAMVERCCVKSWSKTQGTIAQSLAESELIATVRGATEAIGLVASS